MQHDKPNKQPPHQTVTEFQSTVKIIGEYTPLKKTTSENHIQTLNFNPSSKSFIPNNIGNSIMKSCNMYSKVKINPIKVIAQGQTIGIIDQNSNAWILSEIFESPVNISFLLKKRVTQMFLNQKQAILKTKKGLILINWGAKKLFDNQSLTKIPIFDSKSYYQNFFEAFSILDGTPNDIFLISNIKKSQNSIKMYRITNQGTQIHGYPTLQKFKGFDSKILGISVGKYHTLCWDEHGGIYSWGSRSLALGFDSLPDEDLNTQPTRLNFNFLVKTAFASNQYSLALSSDGKLYEWGIKKEVNQINEELIFQPRALQFKYFNCSNQKFTTLKGKNEKFGIISTTGEIYVWGQKTRIFIHPHASVPKQWQNGRLFEPYLVHIPPEQKLIDFIIEQNYLCLILIPKSCKYQMKQQTEYWNNVISNVKNKFQLRKYRKLETQGTRHMRKKTTRMQTIQTETQNTTVNDQENVRRQMMIKRQLSNRQIVKSQNSFRGFLKTSRDDRISKAQMIKKSKQKYLLMAKSQQNLIKYIMQPLKNQRSFQLFDGQIPKREYKKSHATIALTLNLMKINTAKKQSQEPVQNQNRNNFYETVKPPPSLPDYLKDYDFQKIQQIKKRRRQENKKLLYRTSSDAFTKRKTDNKSYTMRLQQVLEKKKQLQIENFNQTIKKLQENSLEHRMKRHLQLQNQRQREQNKQLLKNTLYKYLIKNYIVKMFGSPLSKGREIKIENFARNLKFQRIQKNIRKVFIKAKVRFAIKKLQTLNFSRFALLTLMWRRYVIRFRKRKYNQNRRFIVEQVTKFFEKDKIKMGLSTSNLNVRKIQKFREWLALVKNERAKCLKFLWKVQLMGIMKINPENQNMVVCHLPKNTEQITFETLYNQKILQNPNLKLQTFLNKSPLFKIKVQYFRTVANLFTEEKRPLHRSQKIINYLAKKKKTKIKFFDNEFDEEKQPSHKLNIMSGDVYPYSLHYNYFSRPKNYDISLSELMRKSDKWIKQQKAVLQKILDDIIFRHQKLYLKKSLQYDLELARYIRDKYDVFSEKRWKYIIEYNQIEKTVSKKKREKQLYRIMDLIGMRKLLDQDCIPQKHIILQEAMKKKDSPKPPNELIVFGQKEFKEAFRIYYEHINVKAKQMRKLI